MASDRPRPRNGYNKQYWSEYYEKNRNWISEKKRAYNRRPEVKKRSKEYHYTYYLIHKDEMNRKQRERYRNRKSNK